MQMYELADDTQIYNMTVVILSLSLIIKMDQTETKGMIRITLKASHN